MGQAHAETSIIKLHGFFQGCCRAVVEIRSSCGQTAENRAFELPDISPLSCNQCSARIGGRHFRSIGLVAQGNDREIMDSQWICHISDTDVQRSRHGVIPHVERIVTGAAGAFDEWKTRGIVESPHARNVDGVRVEELLSSENTCTAVSLMAVMVMRSRMSPVVGEEREDDRCEGRLKRVEPQRVVDPDVKRLRCEDDRAATCAMNIEGSHAEIYGLRRREGHFKVHDLLLLFCSGWR